MKKRPDDPEALRASALAAELRVLIGKLKRRLRNYSNLGDLTWPQISVLGRLDADGPATVTSLAKADDIRPQSMGATVAALEAVGLVSRTADPNDGRQTIWSLTPACRKWIDAGRAARQDWLFRAIQKHLSPQEQEELASAMRLLKRLVDS
jgi:DNA-binding MarR family transcriptional regulator